MKAELFCERAYDGSLLGVEGRWKTQCISWLGTVTEQLHLSIETRSDRVMHIKFYRFRRGEVHDLWTEMRLNNLLRRRQWKALSGDYAYLGLGVQALAV
jgi:hypothetical protein